jgi:hypothetical protein
MIIISLQIKNKQEKNPKKKKKKKKKELQDPRTGCESPPWPAIFIFIFTVMA